MNAASIGKVTWNKRTWCLLLSFFEVGESRDNGYNDLKSLVAMELPLNAKISAIQEIVWAGAKYLLLSLSAPTNCSSALILRRQLPSGNCLSCFIDSIPI